MGEATAFVGLLVVKLTRYHGLLAGSTMTDTMIYSTMAEKVAAYDAFFRSSDVFLIVMGVNSDAVGKSEALRAVEHHPSYMLMMPHEDPVSVNEKVSSDEDYNNGYDWKERTIYHLRMGDTNIANDLVTSHMKDGVRVLRFARG
jgi:hypothetical protein